MDLFNTENAAFDKTGKYKYYVYKQWNESKPNLMVIGLNPSSSKCQLSEPTVRRCMKIANELGYGGLYMVNLFSFITSDPNDLDKINDPVGKENDKFIEECAKKCKKIVFAWGSITDLKGRDKKILADYEGYCFGRNQDGNPKHPLFLKRKVKLVRYKN